MGLIMAAARRLFANLLDMHLPNMTIHFVREIEITLAGIQCVVHIDDRHSHGNWAS